MAMAQFAVARLGKDSVEQIKLLDALHASPAIPIRFNIVCSQVQSEVKLGTFLFFCLGSDNNDGRPTSWIRGVRGFGQLLGRTGGPAYNDKWTLDCEVGIIFSQSLTKRDFLAKASKAYFWFADLPVIGLEAFSAQTIQLIKEEKGQDVRALFYAIDKCDPGTSDQVREKYQVLGSLLEYRPDEPFHDEPSVTDSDGLEFSSDDIEGLDEGSKSDWGNYPIDSVLVRTEPRTVFEVIRRIDSGQYTLNPDFQRGFIWPEKKQSRLIESALMRIPLPVFYLAEQTDGKVVVVDGLQRLTTLARFVKNEFVLSGLTNVDPDLNGRYFKQLDPVYQNRIEDTQLILYLIDPRVPMRVRLDIFDRVNSGIPLTRQQMRNSLFNGKATKFLKAAAESIEFKTATGGSVPSKTMRDRELVNRFCAFRLLPLAEYKGDVEEHLAKVLIAMNTMPDSEIESLLSSFKDSMELNTATFGGHAFRKHTGRFQGRSVINAALFEVFSVEFSKWSANDFSNRNIAKIQDGFYKLMTNQTFHSAISQGTSDVSKVRTRFSMVEAMVKEVLT